MYWHWKTDCGRSDLRIRHKAAVTDTYLETGGGVEKDKATPHGSTRVGAKGREDEHHV